jgi:hypothetical protein
LRPAVSARFTVLFLALWCGLAGAGGAFAQANEAVPLGTDAEPLVATPTPEKPFALTLKMGGGYDSDVSISQINSSTGQSDTLANLGLSASYKPLDRDGKSLSLGYDFSQSLHSKLSAFDIQVHSASLTGGLRTGKAYLGLAYSFNHILLAKRPFLDMHFTSPSIMVPLSRSVFVRASHIDLDETFLTDRRRDAKHHEPGVQLFYFWNQSRSFVLIGGNVQREKAVAAEYSFHGLGLNGSINLPLRIGKSPGKVKAAFDHVRRDYRAITPLIGAIRFDRTSTYSLSAEVPLVKKLSLGLELRRADRRSNLSVANIDETAANADLILRF